MIIWSVSAVTIVLVRHFRSRRLIPESLSTVTTDEQHLAVCDPAGHEVSTAWAMIERILLRTTDQGPFLPDVLWVIEPIDSDALIFPGGASGESEAIRAFQVHLAGFRDDEVVTAMGCTSNREFVVWERELYCSFCKQEIPRLTNLNHEQKIELRRIRETSGPITAIKHLREISGCDLKTAKAWVQHGGIAGQGHMPTAPCPYCKRPLRSAHAKQCRFCKSDWHNPRAVQTLGNSQTGA